MTHQPGEVPQDPQHGPPGYGAPGGPPPPPGHYGGPPAYRLPDHPEATKALVLGIVALLGGFTCYLPLVIGPWAWVVGRRVVRQIDAQPGRYEGRGMGMAGYVLGVVATVLLVLGVLAAVLFLTLFVGTAMVEAPDPLPGQSF